MIKTGWLLDARIHTNVTDMFILSQKRKSFYLNKLGQAVPWRSISLTFWQIPPEFQHCPFVKLVGVLLLAHLFTGNLISYLLPRAALEVKSLVGPSVGWSARFVKKVTFRVL